MDSRVNGEGRGARQRFDMFIHQGFGFPLELNALGQLIHTNMFFFVL